MGKVRKFGRKYHLRHDPLDRQISEDRYAQASSRNKIRGIELKDDEFVDEKLACKILEEARKQRACYEQKLLTRPILPDHTCVNSEEPEGIAEEEFVDLASDCSSGDESDRERDFPRIDKVDETALEKFMVKEGGEKETLADFIKEKLTAKKTEIHSIFDESQTTCVDPVDTETLMRFKQLIPVLRDYRSGKLPKAFKAIPRFCNWEQIVLATEPDQWSAAAMYAATRMFSSNLQDKMAQRFYNLVLLPRIRDDIAESKKLNDHLYKSLKKALFKPAAFFKGIIIPLCNARDCTYREATILGSILAKYSVPLLHSSAALLTIAEIPYNGVESIFMRILLEKKYGLPYRVINAVAKHFASFIQDKREFPLLWHQCLLTFVENYKNELSVVQKKDLLKLITVHKHRHVTREIRRELLDEVNPTIVQHLWKM